MSRCVPLACIAGLVACEPIDVEPPPPPPPSTQYALSDAAFGEYLQFLGVPGVTATEEEGTTVYSIDVSVIDGVIDLPLGKTSAAVKELLAAELVTAEDKLVDVDGVQHFTNLESLRLTANDLQALDVSALAELRVLEMNFNLVGALDLTASASLERLRYQGSALAEDGQALTSVDLSGNPALRHLSLPNHRLVTVDLSNNPLIDDVLDLSGNPGPDGDPETGDIVVPHAIYEQLEPESRLGVVSDADVGVLVSLVTSALAIDEGGGTVTLTANLNVEAPGNVTVALGFGGSATRAVDYAVGSAQLSIPAGTLSASTSLTAVDDEDLEGIEFIEVTLEDVTGAAVGPVDAAEITIVGDDLDPGLVINEVLYDPSNDPAGTDGLLPGDANGDGVYVQDEDEFVELVNLTGKALDLAGYGLWDTTAWTDDVPRHVVPGGTVLEPGAALVVFGGGTPTGTFGGATVQTTTTGAINLNNAGDLLRVTDTEGRLVLQLDIEPLSNNPNESYTRNPDLTGGFEQHGTSTSQLFSPGTRIDGTPF